jgi:hypothetical protein
MLFDTCRRVAWLVPEICAILHLMKAEATRENCNIAFPNTQNLDVANLEQEATAVIQQPQGQGDVVSARDLFRKYHSVFCQMKERPVLNKSGKRFDVFKLHRSSVLFGADFEEIAALSPNNRSFEILETELHPRNGAWVDILEPNANRNGTSFKILTLFYNNPRPAPITPLNTCEHWADGRRPHGLDYLITRADCLNLLISQNDGDPPKLSPRHYWIRSTVYPPRLEQCPGGQFQETKYCDMLQKISLGSPDSGTKPGIQMLEAMPQAALIFGKDLPPIH